MLCDPLIRKQIADLGLDPDQLIDNYISVINRVLESRPDSMTVAMHICRGNFRSRWMAQGSYEPIADRLFNQLDVNAFFLEYDTDRAGNFAPLRFIPSDKLVVLGLVTSKKPDLESEDFLANRIDQATKYLSVDQLAISPQCGFASVAGGNELTEEQQFAKLALLASVADRVWGSA